MLKRYNIAFVPNENRELFINYAKELTHNMGYERYLLGLNSIPHVSLCHFEIDENEITNVWEKIIHLDVPPINLTFNSQRSKSYPGHPKWGGVFWVSLIPDKLDNITEVHLKIAEIIKIPLNASFNDYDPHLTLLNSCNEEMCTELSRILNIDSELEDEFSIALGEIDEEGQLINIIYDINNNAVSNNFKI